MLTIDLNAPDEMPGSKRKSYPAAKMGALVLVGRLGCTAQLRSEPDDSWCLGSVLYISAYIKSNAEKRLQGLRVLTLKVGLFVAPHGLVRCNKGLDLASLMGIPRCVKQAAR